MSQKTCYHCGLPVPAQTDLSVIINDQAQAMCCAGCQAVAQAIVDNGLTDFYTYRTTNSPTGQVLIPEFLQQTTVYDNPAIQKRFVRQEEGTLREVSLILEGITCAACVWLNERHLRTLTGIVDVQVNYTTHRARVRWDNQQIQLSSILQAISQIGYLAHPYDPAKQQAVLEKERRYRLRQIGVAGVLGMQIMMFSIALYAGMFSGIEKQYKLLFYWINLIFIIPILLYSAQDFFTSAWRDIKHRQAGMDVPISLGIGLAFIGSLWTTLSGGEGHVYYDSIAMFVFFVLTARYFELIARQRSAQASENLVHLVPTMATRLQTMPLGLQEELVLVAELEMGDKVLVRPGDNIPVDGTIIIGASTVDESLLTGESFPVTKIPGQTVIAGTVNIDSPLQIQVDKIGAETVLSHILRLLERAQTEKPHLTQLADRVASWFVFGVLLLAVGVAIYWWLSEPSRWLEITLSVLVVTCPCALSLATPAAITAATGTLTRFGLLITRGHALETFAQATHFIFDKTGTLTQGQLKLLEIQTFAHLNSSQCLAHAIALECHSEHPIASALLQAHHNVTDVVANYATNYSGAGLEGEIGNRFYYIGTPAFITEKTQLTLTATQQNTLQQSENTIVILADAQTIYAAFILGDDIRQGATELVTALKQQGKKVLLFSGDQATAVQRVAKTVGIEQYEFALSPEDKLNKVKELQQQGAIVAMLGDGVNDAPVLAQAQISIAMGSGTQIARANADMILLTEQLSNILIGLETAQKTLTIIKQNMLWAIAYNLIALPAAAMGWVTPWLAAIGMSTSSLLVVANALRLIKKQKSSDN